MSQNLTTNTIIVQLNNDGTLKDFTKDKVFADSNETIELSVRAPFDPTLVLELGVTLSNGNETPIRPISLVGIGTIPVDGDQWNEWRFPFPSSFLASSAIKRGAKNYGTVYVSTTRTTNENYNYLGTYSDDTTLNSILDPSVTGSDGDYVGVGINAERGANQAYIWSNNTWEPARVDGDTVSVTTMVNGTIYRIIEIGTTDFTTYGASSNTVGLTFTATGAGTGTGTIKEVDAGGVPQTIDEWEAENDVFWVRERKSTAEFNYVVNRTHGGPQETFDMTIADVIAQQYATLNAQVQNYVAKIGVNGEKLVPRDLRQSNILKSVQVNADDEIYFQRLSLEVDAVNLVAGSTYIIKTIGTTDFTLVGAASNTVGELFVATGAGTGTGVTKEVETNGKRISVADFVAATQETFVGTFATATGLTCPDPNDLLCTYPNNILDPADRLGYVASVQSTNTLWRWSVPSNLWSDTGQAPNQASDVQFDDSQTPALGVNNVQDMGDALKNRTLKFNQSGNIITEITLESVDIASAVITNATGKVVATLNDHETRMLVLEDKTQKLDASGDIVTDINLEANMSVLTAKDISSPDISNASGKVIGTLNDHESRTDALETKTQLLSSTGSETTVTGKLIVTNGLDVQGTVTQMDTVNVNIKDNIVKYNEGETGAGVTAGTAGIEIDRGTSTNAQIVFDESDDTFKAGIIGSLKTIPGQTEVTLNSDHRTGDGTDHAQVAANTSAIATISTSKEDVANKVDTITGNENDTDKYLSTKGHYDDVNPLRLINKEDRTFNTVTQVNNLITRLSSDTTLYNTRIDYIYIPSGISQDPGIAQYSIDGGVTYKKVKVFNVAADSYIDLPLDAAVVYGDRFILSFDTAMDAWITIDSNQDLERLRGAGYVAAMTVAGNFNKNTDQDSRLDNLEANQGVSALQETLINNDIVVTTNTVAHRVAFESVSIPSNEPTILTVSGFDQVVNANTEPGINVNFYAQIQNTGSLNSTAQATFYLVDESNPVVSGLFVVGQTYIINSIGTTDFTAIGAASNTVGIVFIATGIGAGNGNAKKVFREVVVIADGQWTTNDRGVGFPISNDDYVAPFTPAVYYTLDSSTFDIKQCILSIVTLFPSGNAPASTSSTILSDSANETPDGNKTTLTEALVEITDDLKDIEETRKVINLTYQSNGQFLASIPNLTLEDRKIVTVVFPVVTSDLDLDVEVSLNNGSNYYDVEFRNTTVDLKVRNVSNQLIDLYWNGTIFVASYVDTPVENVSVPYVGADGLFKTPKNGVDIVIEEEVASNVENYKGLTLQNLAPNPSFDENDSGLPNGWTGNSTYIQVDTTDRKVGENCIKITGDGVSSEITVASVVEKQFPIEVNDVILIKGWIKSTFSGLNPGQIFLLGGANQNIDIPIDASEVDEWIEFSKTITVTNADDTVRIRLDNNSSGTTGVVKYDGIVVTKINGTSLENLSDEELKTTVGFFKGIENVGSPITVTQELDNSDNFNNWTTQDFTAIKIDNIPYQKYTSTGGFVNGIIPTNLLANTMYTMLVHVPINELSTEDNFTLARNVDLGIGVDLRLPSTNIGVYKLLLKVGTITTNQIFSFVSSNEVAGNSVVVRSAIIEGDLTNISDEQALEIIKYQEFGEFTRKGVTIKTVGKNKFDGNYYNALTGSDVTGTYQFQFKGIPNKQYTCSSDVVASTPAGIYFGGTSTTSNGVSDGVSRTVTADENGEILLVIRYDDNTYDELVNGDIYLQIELGPSATEYEVYKESTAEIIGELAGIGGVQDDLETQRFGIDRNDVLQNTTGWSIGTVLTNTHSFIKNITSQLGLKFNTSSAGANLIALRIGEDIYKAVSRDDINTLDVENLVSLSDFDGSIFIKVNKTTYPGSTAFQAYLQANDVEFIYEIETYLPRTEANNNLIEVRGSLLTGPDYSYRQTSFNNVINEFEATSSINTKSQVNKNTGAIVDVVKDVRQLRQEVERQSEYDQNVVTLDTTQNISGLKTFTNNVNILDDGIAQLRIESSVGSQAKLALENTEGEYQIINDSGALFIYDQDNAAERIRLTSAGNLGIGTSTATAKLEVKNSLDAGAGRIKATDQDNRSIVIDSPISGGNARVKVDGTVQGLTLGTRDYIDMILLDGSNGNVGIAKSSPQYPLDVDGSARIAGDLRLESTFPRIYLRDTDSDSDYSIINSNGSLLLYDDTNALTRFRIDSDGDVGIGTTPAADARLHVLADGTTGYVLIENVDGSSNSNAVLRVDARSGVDNTFRIQRNGLVGINTSSLSETFTVNGSSEFRGNVNLTSTGSTSPELKIANDTYVAGIDLYNSTKTLRFIDRTDNASRISFDLSNGSAFFNGSVSAISGFKNTATSNNSKLELLDSGAKITRNIASTTNSAFVVNQLGAGSTGAIQSWESEGSSVANIKPDGTFTTDGNVIAPNLAIATTLEAGDYTNNIKRMTPARTFDTIDKVFSGATSTLNMNGNYIQNPLDPTLGTHVGDRDYNDARYTQETTGTISFTGADFTNVDNTLVRIGSWLVSVTAKVTKTTWAINDELFTLPINFRPPHSVFTILQDDTFPDYYSAFVEITSAGVATIRTINGTPGGSGVLTLTFNR